METLRKGARGEAVKILQKALGITQDGIFGAITETYVKSFQKKVGLVADGIVGVKTWAKLLPDGNASGTGAVDSCVIYKPLNVHLYSAKGRSIKYLVIHFTESSHSRKGRALDTYNTFVKKDASADFCVDDVDIVQFNPDIANKACWAVGGANYHNHGGSLYGKATNMNCISIEICSTCVSTEKSVIGHTNHEGWSLTDAALNNAVKIARILMKKFNIPVERVIRHYDVNGKLCPGVIGWNDEPIVDMKTGKKTGKMNNSLLWEAFKKRLA